MKVTFEAEDQEEANRILKSLDMAICIHQIEKLIRKAEYELIDPKDILRIIADNNIYTDELIQ